MNGIFAALPRLAALCAALVLAGCDSASYRDTSVPMTTAGPVDLDRYAGRWFEIARFPNSFEEGCVGVTADYTVNPDGTVTVLNTCREGTLDGEVTTAEGVATSTNADNDRLEVTFVPWLPFAKGDYWILDLTPDYTVVVIGAPKGTTGWILARMPQLDPALLEAAKAVLTKNGYDIGKLTYTPQSGN
ncbi:lipocalin family protein [Rhodobacteraceae bacterium NNCM2]|nr:lipocalin family protein [Coraliihabitans acroporae]